MARASAAVVAAFLSWGCAAHVEASRAQARSGGSAAPSSPRNENEFTFVGADFFGSRSLRHADLARRFTVPTVGTKVDFAKSDLPQRLAAQRDELLKERVLAFGRVSFTAIPKEQTLGITFDLVDANDAWRIRFTPAPTGRAEDPEGLLAAYAEYVGAYWKLRNAGKVPAPEESVCHATFICLSSFDEPTLAPYEKRFAEAVPRNFDALVRVLREDADMQRRTSAVQLMGFMSDRARVVTAVTPFTRDKQDGVRDETLRALGHAQDKQPQVIIPLETVLDGLWLPLVSDRNKAGWALVRILQTDPRQDVKGILEKSGDALVGMTAMQGNTDWEPAVLALELMSGLKLGHAPVAWKKWAETVVGHPLHPLA